ncbi:phage integrase SAM-like domain-containing protein [Hymenobacter cellulosilyticus]|uniref:Phage integrase SAM-like domain-containing protein n=1 Tax=Hymenobacter cellulosilyticus TaxID=2932248 RepID=A0A8T9QCY8_9BACT|nr:phage integrase SAM-like domain-containing protein [Hymenobacter cellulosilyticus]UOQ75095.1 phage integrase SAM-like domain-containing protein [Hymenobacter cellulosilyticus]
MIAKGLGIAWYPELFDEVLGVCLSSLPKGKQPSNYKEVLQRAHAAAGGTQQLLDKLADDYNLIIGQARAKANDIFVEHRLLTGQTKKALTIERFNYSYDTDSSRNDFITWMEAKIHERSRKGKGHRLHIGPTTKKNHTSTLNCLKAFRSAIPFDTIDAKFVDDFHGYLLKTVKAVNTRWGGIKM